MKKIEIEETHDIVESMVTYKFLWEYADYTYEGRGASATRQVFEPTRDVFEQDLRMQHDEVI